MFGSNYIEEAKKHEVVFRMLLDMHDASHKDLSIEEIYKEYSEGNRCGIWTILDFKQTEENIFFFAWEDVAFMSGFGRADLYKLENEKISLLKNESVWMS